MKKQLRFFFVLLFFVLFAYLLRPSSEHLEKLAVVRGVTLAAEHKKAVADFYAKHQSLPAAGDAEDAGSIRLDLAGTAVEKISIGDDGPGTVVIYYTSDKLEDVPEVIDGTKITLTPQAFGESITWTCNGTVPEEYLPNACR